MGRCLAWCQSWGVGLYGRNAMQADHFIWSAYGTWMPNCPHESWPRYIQTWERSRVEWHVCSENGQKEAAVRDPYRVQRMVSEKSRRFPPVRFSPLQAQGIAEGFERCTRIRHAWIWACAIMPDHVQMLVTCPRTQPTLLAGLMRSEATKRLMELNLHPMSDFAAETDQPPLMWSHVKWHRSLKDDESIHEAIEYLQNLPQRDGEAVQDWNFVREFHSLDRCREENEAYEYQAAAG